MNKLAIFVEGYTEVVFVEKLIEEIAGENRVLIESKRIRGGKTTSRSIKEIKATRIDPRQEYYVLIYDCGGDEQVKTRIMEEQNSLTTAGYSRLIGLRDVRPRFSHTDIPKLELYLPKYIKTSLVPVTFILAVMEIEAWFLAETTHFPRIDPAVTVDAIRANLGFDPENDNLEMRNHPARDLEACYALGGKTYEKHNAQLTVDALDFACVYIELRRKISYLDRLITEMDNFLS